MNKLYPALLFLAIACCNIPAQAGQKLRVYFVGNSYTYYNDMPKMVADIAASMGDTLVFESHTPGGWTLQQHWNPGSDPCPLKVKNGSWDYVVLQEQSQMPAFGQMGPSHPTYYSAEAFNKIIRDSSKCTALMFYMTWGYKNGDAGSCPSVINMCTYQGMDSMLRTRYMQMADSFDAVVSPAGAVRRYIRQNHPGIELYDADGSHPSLAGSYAVACCFYAALFKKDPTLTSFNSSLAAADAANIKAAAKTVVYDSFAKWGLGVYDLASAYDFAISGTTVTFTNKSSLKALTYSWNFGDGNTSTLKDPVHTYAVKNNYIVTLTAYDANGCGRVVSDSVNMVPADIDDVARTSFSIIPNPATDCITIQPGQQLAQYNIRITSAMGQTVYQGPANGSGINKIDLSAFSSGMYYITLYNDTAVLHYDKFVKQ